MKEKLFQSCKKVRFAILDIQSFISNVLSATMRLVEQVFNARPLTAVIDEPKALTALRPNHFLIGRESAKAPFIPSKGRKNDMDSQPPPAMETEIEIVKQTCAKPGTR